MATHRLEIPRWRPCPLNRLLYAKVRDRIRLKRADRQMVGTYFALAGLPMATGRRRVSLLVRLGPRMREFDVDAMQKSALDALVECGALTGDRQRDVEWGGVVYERGTAQEWGTVIVLEDLDTDSEGKDKEGGS